MKKSNKILNQFKQYFISLESILEIKTVSITDFEHLFLKIEKFERNRGGLETIRMLKNVRVSIYNYIASRQIQNHGVSVYKRTGIPKILGPKISKSLETKDHPTIRAVLTALNYSRMIDEWKEPDISTIVGKPTYDGNLVQELKNLIPTIVGRLFPSGIDRPVWECPHFTTKSSPQGVAMMTLKSELDDLAHMPEKLRDMYQVAGGTMEHYVNTIKDKPEIFRNVGSPKASRKGRLRSLGVVKDSEGKSRIIAMADYWTQTSLKPLHEKLLYSLRSIRMDVTFGQDIGPFGRASQDYFSFDLTAATDRIPIFIYESILEHLFGKDYSESWTRLMIDIPFHWRTGLVKYETGQPMGMYSSWALLAIGHHVIVQWAAYRSGSYGFGRHFNEYRLLGDDIVIRNDLVAHYYATLLQELGVEISPQKSLVSRDTFEFAKRLFHQGLEVTGFPLSGWVSASKLKWIDQSNIIETAIKRGYSFSQLVKLETLIKIQEASGKSYDLRRKIARNILSQQVISNLEPNQLAIVGRLWGHRISCVTSRENFKRYIMNKLSDLSLQSYLDSIKRTVKQIQTLEDFKSDRFVQDRYARAYMVASSLPPKVYKMAPNLYEPYVHVLGAALHNSINRQNDLEDKFTNNGIFFTDFSGYLEFLRKSDMRIPNLYVRDPSRKSERGFKLVSTMSVRALSRKDESTVNPVEHVNALLR
jgi:hypothetical protein